MGSGNAIVHESWQIIIHGNIKVYKNIETNLREYITTPPIKDLWDRHNRIEKNAFDKVAWLPLQKVMKSSTIQTRHWIVKRAAGDCGTNAVLFRRKKREDDKCPFCGQTENTAHVYKCKDPKVSDVWEKSIYNLEREMMEYQTDPEIVHQLSRGLLAWKSESLLVDNELVRKQNDIGWEGILEGCIGAHWQEEQELYYSENNIKKWPSMGNDGYSKTVENSLGHLAT
jgi:hypothetical protein